MEMQGSRKHYEMGDNASFGNILAYYALSHPLVDQCTCRKEKEMVNNASFGNILVYDYEEA